MVRVTHTSGVEVDKKARCPSHLADEAKKALPRVTRHPKAKAQPWGNRGVGSFLFSTARTCTAPSGQQRAPTSKGAPRAPRSVKNTGGTSRNGPPHTILAARTASDRVH